jgi:hypothetical protein
LLTNRQRRRDFREKTWEALREVLPVMMKEGIPLPPSAFDDSSERKHVTQLMADFRREILKQSKGEGGGGTVVVDAASAIAKPVAQLLSKMDATLGAVAKGHENSKAAIDSLVATQAKKGGKRRAVARPQADGSFVLETADPA